MVVTSNCSECGNPLPRRRHSETLLMVEILDLRDDLASLDPSARKFGFCDRGVELASLIHHSVHDGEMPWPLRRKAKRWLREANKRFDVWQALHEPAQLSPQAARQQQIA